MDSTVGYLLAAVIVYFLVKTSELHTHSRRPHGVIRADCSPSCSAPLCRKDCQSNSRSCGSQW
jgi:exosome complex RNA-binding protein Csl4